MNAKLIVSLFGIFLATSSFASATVSDVTSKQRWPFSGKVDIDFTLSGEDAVELDYFVKYDGVADWVKLDAVSLSGDVKSAKVGACHAVWDPAKSGFGGKTLTGFSAKVEAASFSDRKYLVVDIQNGTFVYMSEPPAGGWSTEGGYKTSKMPFRRIPAGDYTIGHPKDDIAPLWPGYSGWWPQFVAQMGQRNVTVSSDYYIAVFPTTSAQANYINGSSGSSEASRNNFTYQDLRGADYNWPVDKFAVASDSLIGKFRARLGNNLLIDLPTATQYEIAMRAGTATIFPNGGTKSDTRDVLKSDYYLKLSSDQSENVGLRDPNGWGIYNSVGMNWYLLLDAASASNDRETTTGQHFLNFMESGTDPIGHTVTDASDRLRMAMGGGWWSNDWKSMLGWHSLYTETQGLSVRYCIHLDSSLADKAVAE